MSPSTATSDPLRRGGACLLLGLLVPVGGGAAQEPEAPSRDSARAAEAVPGDTAPDRGADLPPGERARPAGAGARRAVAGRAELADRLRELLDDPALERAHVGLVVQVAETGEVLFDRAGEKRFTPASVAKLVPAAVALRRLGPGFRWRTRLVAGGRLSGGRLVGDLWVVGSGDPTLAASDLARWASRIRAAGVRRIAGDLVGDARAFPAPRWGRGWMWDDLHLAWATGVSGLQLDRAGVEAYLVPGASVGAPARVRVAAPDTAPPVPVEARTGAPGSSLRLRYLPGPAPGAGGRIDGWVPADADSVRLSLAPRDPVIHLLERFRRVLRDSAVAVEGRVRRPGPDDRAPEAEPLAVFRSDSLGAVLREVLRPSDNEGAEALLRTLGRELGRAGTAREGLEVVRETLADWGIDPEAVSLADGSGLSRYDAVTPRAMTRLLRAVWRSPHHRMFADALPAPGERGTLRARFLGTPARDAVRAKTGSLSSVRGLAGYVEDGDGETLIFALLVNGYDVPGAVADGLRDLLVEQLSLYHRPVEPGWPRYRAPPDSGPPGPAPGGGELGPGRGTFRE